MTTTINETKIIDKINKLLALAGNNPSQEEAQSAMLKAQELMAEYGIDDLTSEEDVPEFELVACKHRDNSGFRGPLSTIIARNFRCKAIIIGGVIHFLGYKQDALIAKNVFEFAYRFVKREGEKEIDKARESYGHARGVFNSYSIGFLYGLKAALDAQCTALMIVVPQEVNAEFDNRFPETKTAQTLHQKAKNRGVYDKGYKDGKSIMDKRTLKEGK